MKLNDSFLAVQFQQGVTYSNGHSLKTFYIAEHLNPVKWAAVTDWPLRERQAQKLIDTPRQLKFYYITDKAQREAGMIRKGKEVDLKWFNQVSDQHTIYVTGKDEFYRWYKEEGIINVLRFQRHQEKVDYDCYRILLDDGTLRLADFQDRDQAERFINLLLFIELGQVDYLYVPPKGKVKWSSSGEDRLLNEAEIVNAYVVNSHWNKIVKINGVQTVSGHLRIQPYGPGRAQYKVIWIEEYTKGGGVQAP